MAKQLPRNWVEMRREWPGLSAYQRFEAFWRAWSLASGSLTGCQYDVRAFSAVTILNTLKLHADTFRYPAERLLA
jgi:hypothetical protein